MKLITDEDDAGLGYVVGGGVHDDQEKEEANGY